MKKTLSFLMSLVFLSACTPGKAPEPTAALPEKIKIGVVAPLSGDAAAYGIEMQRVLAYEVDRLNASLKSQGTQVELIYEDGKCAGNDAVAAFQKLTDLDGVKFILGGFCSSETLAMDPLAAAKKILLVSSVSSNPDLENASDYTFSFSYSDDLIGKTLAQELNRYSKIAIYSEQNDFNMGVKKTVEAALDPQVQVVSNEIFPKGAAEFRNALAEIKAAEPEALFLNPNPGATAENLIKQWAEIENWDVKLISHIAYLADNTRSAVGDRAEGMVLIDAPKLNSPELDQILAEIVATQGSVDTLGLFYTASTIDDFRTLTQLILKNGYEVEAVRQELASGTFEGLLGNLSFAGNNFVQGIGAGKYIVTEGKAEFQN